MLKLQKFSLHDSSYKDHYPFKDGETYLFLGEIRHMPGHGAWASKGGRVYWGYHTDNFEDITEEEI